MQKRTGARGKTSIEKVQKQSNEVVDRLELKA